MLGLQHFSRLRAAALVAALGAAAFVGPALGTADLAAAVSGRCAPGSGVTVVIDFGSGGPDDQIFCAPDGGGKDADVIMRNAGVSFEYSSGEPFVCRIQGFPSPEDESCTQTAPANAFWGLFWSDGSPATWNWSSYGATSTRVPNGGSVGWAFQDGGSRDYPSSAPTPRPKPSPSPNPSKPAADSSDAGSKPSPSPSRPAPTSSAPQPSASAGDSATPEAEAQSARSERVGRAAEGDARDKGDEKASDARDRKDRDKDERKRDDRKQDARDREDTTEESFVIDEDDEVVAGGEFVAPVSADSSGLTSGELAMLAVGGLCAAGLAASAVVMARRRRV